MPKYIQSNSTGKLGVNYVCSVVVGANCIFNKIESDNDIGIDATIELIRNERPLHKKLEIQIKSGKTYYVSRTQECLIPIKDHREYWARNRLPVIGIVYVPSLEKGYWIDIKAYLKSHPEDKKIRFKRTEENVFVSSSLEHFELIFDNDAVSKPDTSKYENDKEIQNLVENASFLPIVMAGGLGTRVIHLSPDGTPKQFWKLYGRDSMLQDIVSRLTSFEHKRKLPVRVLSVENIKKAIINQTKKQTESGLIELWFEPDRKGTTTAIAYSIKRALKEKIISDDSIVGFFPADQYIFDPVKEGTKSGCTSAENRFHKTIGKAIEAAKKIDAIVLIGTPAQGVVNESNPGINYGWIKVLGDKGKLIKVEKFLEKPDPKTIKNMLDSQAKHFWNSGIFIGRASVFREGMLRFLPTVFNDIRFNSSNKVKGFDCDYRQVVEKRMFDVAVLQQIAGKKELNTKVYVIRASYSWEDLGHECTIIEHFRRRNKFPNKSDCADLGEVQIQFFNFNDAETTYVVHENDGDIQIASLNVINI